MMADFAWFTKTSFSYMGGYNKLWVLCQIPYRYYLYRKTFKELQWQG